MPSKLLLSLFFLIGAYSTLFGQTKFIETVGLGDQNSQLERYAFIVGINHYQDPQINSFTSCEGDANEFYATLVSEYGFYHKKKNIVKLPSRKELAPTRNNIITSFNKLLGRIKNPSNAVVTIFYSGHGVPGSIIPQDAKLQLPETFIQYKYFTDKLNGKGVTRQVHIIDACHAASMGKKALAARPQDLYRDEVQNSNPNSVVWFYAVDQGKLAASGNFVSLFSKYFIESLEEKGADKNNDGVLSANEVFKEIKKELGGSQPPKFNGNRDFPMAYVGGDMEAKSGIRDSKLIIEAPKTSQLRGLLSSHGFTYDYDGQVLNGKPHGFGVANFEVGSKYVGDWKNGKRSGNGTMKYNDGDIYSGSWKYDKKNGQGAYTFNSGNSLKGEFRDGKIYNGKKRDKNGKYVSGFINGRISKKTEQEYDTGRESGLKKTQLKGVRGMFGTYDYEGEVLNGKPYGYGTAKYKTGSEYVGEWKEGRRSGIGTIKYSFGHVYTGEWKGDRINGQGRITDVRGNYLKGEFRKGRFFIGYSYTKNGTRLEKYVNGEIIKK